MEYNNGPAFDFVEILTRILRYLIEGLVVATSAYLFTNKKQSLEEVVLIGFIASASLSLLDMFVPAISVTARQGMGFGIGAGLVGWPSMSSAPRMNQPLQ